MLYRGFRICVTFIGKFERHLSRCIVAPLTSSTGFALCFRVILHVWQFRNNSSSLCPRGISREYLQLYLAHSWIDTFTRICFTPPADRLFVTVRTGGCEIFALLPRSAWIRVLCDSRVCLLLARIRFNEDGKLGGGWTMRRDGVSAFGMHS